MTIMDLYHQVADAWGRGRANLEPHTRGEIKAWGIQSPGIDNLRVINFSTDVEVALAVPATV